MEHKSFFRTHKALAFLPLLLMGAGVWYYIQGRVAHERSETTAAPAPALEPAAVSPSGKPPAGTLPEAYNPDAGLDIQGPPEFKSQVTHALKLIWMADRNTFLFIKRNISVIRNENRTGFYAEPGRMVAALSTDHAFRSLTWCAGVIAHQAWHGWYELNTRKARKKAPPLPGDRDASRPEANPAKIDYKGLDYILYTEDKAFGLQLEVLRKVGAPKSETDPVLRRAPRDFTHGHDGSYSLNP
ncbi:MAG: hypothetical protein NDI60_09690 [Elusimicrobiales bacterium]|nr:hypothetical protein [Elusimicrobiales bacterium]